MVRRACCSHLGAFASACSSLSRTDELTHEVVPTLVRLSKDEQDSVRLLVVDACIAVSKLLDDRENRDSMLPVIFNLCADKSWRVRYMVADKFEDVSPHSTCSHRVVIVVITNIIIIIIIITNIIITAICHSNLTLFIFSICTQLCAALNSAGQFEDLLDGFVRLLSDEESEVRTSGATRLGDTAKLIGAPLTIKKLLGPVKVLVKDTNQYTRGTLIALGSYRCMHAERVTVCMCVCSCDRISVNDTRIRPLSI